MEDQVLKIHVAEEAAGQSVERFLRIGLGSVPEADQPPEIPGRRDPAQRPFGSG